MPTTPEQPPTPFAIQTTRAIKARVDRLGVSNAAVARKAGFSPNYLNERFREEKSFTLSDIERLANYFEITPAQLMREAEEISVGGVTDDSFEYTPEPPRPEDHALAAKRGQRKIDK